MTTVTTPETIRPGYLVSYEERNGRYRATVTLDATVFGEEAGTVVGKSGWCPTGYGAARKAESIASDHISKRLRPDWGR